MERRPLRLERRLLGPEHVGFYGGINYGFGYVGEGFGGGEWRGGTFFYNTAVMHVNTVNITNVYVNRTVIVNNDSHVAFNGGQGGVRARPDPASGSLHARAAHVPPVAAQTEHEHAASQNRAMFASTNHGRPAVAATAKPGEFSGRGVVAAKAAGGTYHAPAMSPKEARATVGGNRAAEKPAAANRAPNGKTRTNASHGAEPRGETAHRSTSRTETAAPKSTRARLGPQTRPKPRLTAVRQRKQSDQRKRQRAAKARGPQANRKLKMPLDQVRLKKAHRNRPPKRPDLSPRPSARVRLRRASPERASLHRRRSTQPRLRRASRRPPSRLRQRSTRVLQSRNTKGDKPVHAKQASTQASVASAALAFLCKPIGGSAFLSQARH